MNAREGVFPTSQVHPLIRHSPEMALDKVCEAALKVDSTRAHKFPELLNELLPKLSFTSKKRAERRVEALVRSAWNSPKLPKLSRMISPSITSLYDS